jgi:hypothetical protein
MSTEPGSDPIGDFQRWLMRAGARSLGRDVAGRVKSTIGGAGGGAKRADVWETATTEELTDEPPECQWCPICRAARRYRDSGGPPPAFGGQFGGMGDTLAGLTRDAFSLFDAAVRASQRPPDAPRAPGATRSAGPQAPAGGPGAPAPAPADTAPADTAPAAHEHGPAAHDHGPASHGPSDDSTVVVGSGVGWPTVVHPEHQDDEAADESGNRQESGQPGDGSASGGTDEQVERPAE